MDIEVAQKILVGLILAAVSGSWGYLSMISKRVTALEARDLVTRVILDEIRTDVHEIKLDVKELRRNGR